MDSLDKENTSVSYDGVDMKIRRAFVKLPSQIIGEDLKDSDEVLTNKNLIQFYGVLMIANYDLDIY